MMTENEVVAALNARGDPAYPVDLETLKETFGEVWPRIVDIIATRIHPNEGLKAVAYGYDDPSYDLVTPGSGVKLVFDTKDSWQVILYEDTLEVWPRGGGSGGAGPFTVNF
jgi:hypothetical protein